MLWLYESKVKNVIALMGINCSDAQVEKLLSLSSQFVVWLDKDKSGANGMNMLRVKMDNRAHLKYVDPWKSDIEGKDPKDCYEVQGPEKVLEIIAGAKTFFEHVMEDSCNG